MIKGCDISYYQDDNTTPKQNDFVKLKRHYDWISIRVCFGDIPDEDFAYNWKGAADAGFLRMAYIYYDYRKRSMDQVNKAMDLIGDDKPELYVAWDMEKLYLNGQLVTLPAADNYLSSSITALTTLRNEYGRAISYINPDMIKNYLGYTRASKLAAISDLWIAHWGATNPAIYPWTEYKFHQTGTIVIDPNDYGVESKEIDDDNFNGTMADLIAYSTLETPPEPPPTGDLDAILAELGTLRAEVDGLKAWRGRVQKWLDGTGEV